MQEAPNLIISFIVDYLFFFICVCVGHTFGKMLLSEEHRKKISVGEVPYVFRISLIATIITWLF